MDISLIEIIILIVLGIIAGIINTLAGGGSNLTVPALMAFGMPADIANATNRVGVIFQTIVGIKGFKENDKLPTHDIKGIIKPLIIGGLIGSLFASYAPAYLLKFLLLGAMLLVAGIVLIKPEIISPPLGIAPFLVSKKPKAFWLLVLAGFYGGFVQAGVGFILITAFTGGLRYDLMSSNALKVLATLVFTGIALVIFIVNDQVQWIPGLILALGSMIGAYIGVKIAIKSSQKSLKWFLFLMTIAASGSAIWL